MPAGSEFSPSEKHLPHPKYRPDIDGLRAIAILSVVGFHYFPAWFKGGFIGVDIFFVISGFLISSILFESFENNSFTYKEFYFRRIKRIFPALLIVLSASILIGWAILFLHEFQQLGKHLVGGIAFVSNIILWGEHGYFDNLADTKPLLHLWSLGVEEQFYIVWPLLLAAVWNRKYDFLKTCLIVALVSFIFNIATVQHHPVSSFYLPIGRFWELMLGGILAYLLNQKKYFSFRHLLLLPVLGIALIILGVLLINRQSAFPGWWALLPTSGTFLIMYSHPKNWVNKYILGNRLMVWFGLISYPLYLWHWPLLSFIHIAQEHPPLTNVKLTTLALSILLAWLTYEFAEKRINKMNKASVVYLLGLSSVILLITGSIVWSGIIPPRNSIPLIETAVTDWEHPSGLKKIMFDGRKYYEKQASASKVLFLGDSLLEQYSPRIVKILDENSIENKSVIFATAGGCPPIPNIFEDKHPDCNGRIDSALNYAKMQDVDTVVIGAYWDGYFIHHTNMNTTGEYRYYHSRDNKKTYFIHDTGAQRALDELEVFLKALSVDKKVYLILTNPSGGLFNPKKHITGNRLSGISFSGGKSVALTEAQLSLRNKLTEISLRSNVTLIDPVKALCEKGKCPTTTKNSTPLYKDNIHMRPFYVKESAGFVDETVYMQ